MIYDSFNQPAMDQIPPRVRTVLDLGCGAGGMGEQIRKTRNCAVTGVTFSEEEARIARDRLDRVEVADLNCFDPAHLGQFDCVICFHVLEHLYRPDELLRQIRCALAPGGTLVVALPNPLFWHQRMQFLLGRFRYTDGWLLDRTHYRFYDWTAAARLLEDAGYVIDHAFADGSVPYLKVIGKNMSRRVNHLALRRWPGLFGWQFVFRCHVG